MDRTKLFFFWGEEWASRRQEVTQMLTVPSLAMRRGDFSELLNPANPYFGRARVITDPLTRQPFPNNTIPGDRISPQGQALLNVYPEAVAGFQQGTANWIGTSEQWQDQRKDTIRVDYRIGDKTNLAVRATHIPFHFNTVLGSTRFVELWSRPNRTAVATVNSTLSATFLNEFTVSASSDGLGEANSDPDCGARCRRSTYGVSYPFLFPADSKFDPEKLPTLSINGLSTLDNGPYPGYWSGFTYAISNSMTKVVKTHTLKWGIFVERSGQDDQIHATTASAPATNNQNGAFRFQDTGHPQATGLAMANALLGNFNDYSEFGAKPLTPFVGTALDWFVQDSWKMSQKLTLEAGLRHSIWQPWHSKWNTISMFHPDFYDPAQAAVVDPAGGFIVSGNRYNGVVLPGDGPTEEALSNFPFLRDFTHLYHGLPAGFAPTHKQDFQPRVGLAYSIDQKTIVRVGVGKFFNRTGINRDLAQGGQPPFMEQVTVINGSVDAPSGAQRRVFPFTITAQETTLKHPNAWTGNVTVQRQLPAELSVEVSYVARRGYNNQRKRNINQLLPGTIQANPGINPNALRPFRGMGIIGLAENTGRTEYDALQISANRRLSAGLQFGLGYTFSRNLDNGSGEIELLPNAYDDSGLLGPLGSGPTACARRQRHLRTAGTARTTADQSGAGRMVSGRNLSGTVRRAFLRAPQCGQRRNRARQRRSVLESDRGSQSGHAYRVHRFRGVVQSGRIRATRSWDFRCAAPQWPAPTGLLGMESFGLAQVPSDEPSLVRLPVGGLQRAEPSHARRSQQQSDQRVVWAGDQQDGQSHYAVRRAVSVLGLGCRRDDRPGCLRPNPSRA